MGFWAGTGLGAAPRLTEDPMMFVYHEANKLFSLDEMGHGECAV